MHFKNLSLFCCISFSKFQFVTQILRRKGSVRSCSHKMSKSEFLWQPEQTWTPRQSHMLLYLPLNLCWGHSFVLSSLALELFLSTSPSKLFSNVPQINSLTSSDFKIQCWANIEPTCILNIVVESQFLWPSTADIFPFIPCLHQKYLQYYFWQRQAAARVFFYSPDNSYHMQFTSPPYQTL